jgi:hypothetical protein
MSSIDGFVQHRHTSILHGNTGNTNDITKGGQDHQHSSRIARQNISSKKFLRPPNLFGKDSDDKGEGGLDKGFNLLEIASSVVPQGRIVQTAKESWKFAWKVSAVRASCFCFFWKGVFDTY